MKTLSEVRALSDKERYNYRKQLEANRVVSDIWSTMAPLRRVRQIGGCLDYLYATDSFPLRQSKHLKLSLEENNILNGMLTSYRESGDLHPECEMTWKGYISTANDGDFCLIAYKPDARITGTLHDHKTGEHFTFCFEGVTLVGDSPYPHLLLLMDARA